MMKSYSRTEEHRRRTGAAKQAVGSGLNNNGKASTAIAGVVVFLLGIGLTLFIIANPMEVGLFERAKSIVMQEAETSGLEAQAGARKVLYWFAPMDPTEIYDDPGLSKMGMKLLPKYADEAEALSDNAIRIDPVTIQNIGVVSEPVERGDLKVEIRTVGSLDYNEQKVYWVNTKYDGWIETVYVNFIGEQVQKGEALFEIYSPDLVSTQEEYLSALKYRKKMAGSGFPEAEARAENLLAASRSRLLYWDIAEEQIENLERSGQVAKTLVVASPVTGVVVEKMDQALEGMHAKAGRNLYKIADLSTLWVHVDLYEYQLPWIKAGQEAEVEVSYYPQEVFKGRVLFFYPYLDEKTRTIRVCLEIPNTDGNLRPEMFTTVKFLPVAAKDAVLVPESAVLHTGERKAVVLDLGDGRFEPREVKLGLQGEGRYQILEGLEGTERIVTSAQFLIDSESNYQEAIKRMLMARKGAEAGAPSDAMTMGHSSGAKDPHGSDTKDIGQGSDTKVIEHGSEPGHPDRRMKPVLDDPETVKALQRVLDAYIPLWKTLAADSIEGIDAGSKKLMRAAENAADQVEQEAVKTRLEALKEAASEMKTGDIDAAREAMKAVSRALLSIFEAYDVKMPGRYTIIECPMVRERWIQDTEQVENPFFGSAMLRCGTRVGTIGDNKG